LRFRFEVVEVQRFADRCLAHKEAEFVETMGEIGVLTMFLIEESYPPTEPCQDRIQMVRKAIETLIIVVVPIVSNGMIKGFDCNPVLVIHADHGDNICLGTGMEDFLDFLEIVLVNIIVVVHEAAVLTFGLLQKFLSFESNGLFAVVNVRENFDTQRMLTGVHLGKEGSQGISSVVY
jgi:hypothetical protein